jgi:hypothetical protein
VKTYVAAVKNKMQGKNKSFLKKIGCRMPSENCLVIPVRQALKNNNKKACKA